MLFAVRFFDKPDQTKIRNHFLQKHIDWLDQNKDCVLVGGSLRNTQEEPPVGGLWIVEAESKNAIEVLIESDPFWVNGLRERYEILHWSKAFSNRKVPV